MSNKCIQRTSVGKDLGIMVASDLSWKDQAERRSAKTIQPFQMIKINTSALTTSKTKKGLHRCYIVPIVSYGSVLWKPSKGELQTIETIQKRATAWILGTYQITYKDRLERLKLLPLSLYHELHVILVFLDVLKGRYDINWRKYVESDTHGNQTTRSSQMNKCKTRNLPKKKTRKRLLVAGYKINENRQKETVTRVNTKFFDKRYDQNQLCTWRLLCGCPSCREMKKIDFA